LAVVNHQGEILAMLCAVRFKEVNYRNRVKASRELADADSRPFFVRVDRAGHSSHEARITNPRAVLQREINPAVRVNIRAALSTSILGWLGHDPSPTPFNHKLQWTALPTHFTGRI
jgi:hypothetical protein